MISRTFGNKESSAIQRPLEDDKIVAIHDFWISSGRPADSESLRRSQAKLLGLKFWIGALKACRFPRLIKRRTLNDPRNPLGTRIFEGC